MFARRRRGALDRIRSGFDRLTDRHDDDDDDDDDDDEDDDEHDDDAEDEDRSLSGLQWMAAGLFLAAGAEAALGERRGDYRAPDAIRWAPLVAAPVAGAAHAARALWPGHTTRVLSQIADGIAIGVGAAGFANSVMAAAGDVAPDTAWTERVPSLAPLAFAAVGILGLIIQEEEERSAREFESLERRANIVERFVPKRRARVDRIVVHV
ncbi:MAG: hypothetical protein ACRENP_03325 [Longimicrobiales bacterium]